MILAFIFISHIAKLLCTTHADCESGCCVANNVCAVEADTSCNSANMMSPCLDNSTCMSHFCKENICQYNSDGRCYKHEQCSSGYCNNGYCGVQNSIDMLALGKYCYSHSQCLSSNCTLKACKAAAESPSCQKHSDCKGIYGCCVEEKCMLSSYCVILEKGQPCKYNYECSSLSCNKGSCSNPSVWLFYVISIGFPVGVGVITLASIILTKIVLQKKPSKVQSDSKYMEKLCQIYYMKPVDIRVC
jgi:hypothetical protein